MEPQSKWQPLNCWQWLRAELSWEAKLRVKGQGSRFKPEWGQNSEGVLAVRGGARLPTGKFLMRVNVGLMAKAGKCLIPLDDGTTPIWSEVFLSRFKILISHKSAHLRGKNESFHWKTFEFVYYSLTTKALWYLTLSMRDQFVKTKVWVKKIRKGRRRRKTHLKR